YYFPAARISNCLFDLRHNWSPTGDATVALAGPFFGIMMQRPATYDSSVYGLPVGYLDGRTLIAHNTFVFARWGDTADNDGWESESRPQTVGIIDFTFTSCASIPDADDRFRGVGNPCITSNVFRTRPAPSGATVLPFAMLGIGDEDTRVKTVTGYIQTNAFDPARVGSTNNYFWSLPVASSMVDFTGGIGKWNCQVSPIGGACGTQSNPCSAIATPTQPAAPIWDGSNGLDPAFVGEYIATSTALVDYRDWRLLPGSPLENLGYMPPPGGPRAFITSPHVDSQGVSDPTWHFPIDLPEELHLFQWDGEHWGNPRVVDGAPDIGFDERGLLICAGNWANDSNSHNQPWFMQPGVTPGSSTRYFILPDSAGGVALNVPNRSLRVYQSILTPPSPPATGNGWINPPLSLANPPSSSALPLYYRTKYIAFTQALPWPDQALVAAVGGPYWLLGGATPQAALSFRLVGQIDDECSPPPCTESYFDMQAVVLETSSSNVLLRSNMQGEYR
ncbi:MAG: hypothetical protein Q8K63_07605, partial [Acidimicrobiales bacterium]|nr:hypothetical protein [Acidimicrobiales bacterium]